MQSTVAMLYHLLRCVLTSDLLVLYELLTALVCLMVLFQRQEPLWPHLVCKATFLFYFFTKWESELKARVNKVNITDLFPSKLLRKSLFTPSNSNNAAICRPTQLKRLQFGFFKRNMNMKISRVESQPAGAKSCSRLPSCGHMNKPSRVRRSLNWSWDLLFHSDFLWTFFWTATFFINPPTNWSPACACFRLNQHRGNVHLAWAKASLLSGANSQNSSPTYFIKKN